MATHHDDPNQPRQSDPHHPQPKKDTAIAKEGEDVIGAEADVLGPGQGPLTNPQHSGPATWIAPYQEGDPDADESKNPEAAPPGGYAHFPNLMLDEARAAQPPAPPHAEVVEEVAEVLEDEPLVAEPASKASSTVHVAEVIDDIADDDVEVLGGEPSAPTKESSVVDISALVDDGSSDVVEDATPGSSTVLAESDVVVDASVGSAAKPESSAILAEPASEVAQDIWAEAADMPTPPPVAPSHQADPDAPHFDDAPQHATDEVLGGESDELDNAMLVDPSSVAQVKTEISQPAPAAGTDAKEPDIDWDDIAAAGDSKVAPAKPVAHDSDVIADEAVVAHADSGTVELDDQVAIAGVDPVAEEVESGVNIQKTSSGAKLKTVQDEPTELDAGPIDGSDSVFDEDIIGQAKPPSAAVTQSADDEAAALFADDTGNTPPPEVKGAAVADQEVEFDEDHAKAHAEGAEEGAGLAAFALAEATAAVPAKDDEHAEADEAVDLGAAPAADDEPPAAPPSKKERKTERELVGAGAGKSGRGWLTGMLATVAILGVGAAAVWYAKPDLLEQVSKSSPNAAPVKKENPKAKADASAALARARMDKDQADKALATLKDAESKLRAELVASQTDVAKLKKEVQAAQTAKVQPNKEVPGKVQPKVQEGPQLGAVADALVKAKIWRAKDKIDVPALQKALQSLSESRSSLAAINKLLNDANIGANADQGVAKLLTAKMEVETKLAQVNKVLADEKIRGDGAKGLAELIAARDKLAKESADLHTAIQSAYKELTDADQPPPNADPRATLEEAVKIARKKSEAASSPPERPGSEAAAGRPDPLLAEQFFGKGLELFWSRDYPAAEQKFRKAVALFGQDARYQYFLGMSLLTQGDQRKNAAGYAAMEKAARLEAANKPSLDEVNASLERIQGSMRGLVNSYRQKALVAAQ